MGSIYSLVIFVALAVVLCIFKILVCKQAKEVCSEGCLELKRLRLHAPLIRELGVGDETGKLFVPAQASSIVKSVQILLPSHGEHYLVR